MLLLSGSLDRLLLASRGWRCSDEGGIDPRNPLLRPQHSPLGLTRPRQAQQAGVPRSRLA